MYDIIGALLTLSSPSACLAIGFAAHAVQPYEPQIPNPLTEPWRWRAFNEVKSKRPVSADAGMVAPAVSAITSTKKSPTPIDPGKQSTERRYLQQTEELPDCLIPLDPLVFIGIFELLHRAPFGGYSSMETK